MTDLRKLLGLAPDGRLAILDALAAGTSPVSVEALVAASALPRRDVEEFTAALPPDWETLLGPYRASRARVTDPAGLERAAEELIAGVPAPRKRLDHVQATAATLVRRVTWLTERFDLAGRTVLFAGDHDLTSLLLSRVVPSGTVLTVADIDERLLEYVESAGGGRVRGAWADFRFGLPPSLAGAADVVVTDPPYTPEGVGLFLSRSLEALRRDEPDARIVIAFGHSRRRPDLGVAVQREILSRDVAVDAMLPAFSRYDGAQAVGSASDWYSCQPTPKAFRRLGGAGPPSPGIYTHGAQSVESGAADPADLLPLLGRGAGSGSVSGSGAASGAGGVSASGAGRAGLVAPDPGQAVGFTAAVTLGKLLAGGLHPSVTGRADEWAVDLRDDPGPWLLRALLALNVPRATFVVPRRHEAVAALGADPLLRAKYGSLSPAPAGEWTVVRCSLAAGPSDPGADLARFVTRRAHGRLRNVWREGLIARAADAGGAVPTKREAAARVDEAAAAAGLGPGVLSLRLIDLPAHQFPLLYRALAGSVN